MSIAQTGSLLATDYDRLESATTHPQSRGAPLAEAADASRDLDAPYPLRVRAAIMMVGAALAWVFTLYVLRAVLLR